MKVWWVNIAATKVLRTTELIDINQMSECNIQAGNIQAGKFICKYQYKQ